MKLECLKDKLKWAINLSEKSTGKNLALSALNCVLLEAGDRYLKISATNLDLGVEISLPVKTEKTGRVLVNPGILANFLANLDSEKIGLELINNNLSIATKKNTSVFRTYPVDDFPAIPRLVKPRQLTLPLSFLVSGLRAVWYSASLTDIKPEISSVYIYQTDDALVFVATDSFRLAEKKINLNKPSDVKLKLIVPIKNIAEIIRVFDGGGDEEVTVGWSEHQVSFEVDNIFVVSRLIDGIFPDYRQIIPPRGATEAVVLKDELLRALKLSQIFSDRLNQINLKVYPQEKLLEFNSQNNEIGENSTKLDGDLNGENIEVGFNARYLLDSFQSISADHVNLRFNGKNKPIVINGVGDDGFVYLVMPLNR